MNAGQCWAVARFKIGNIRGLVDYRVREPGAVAVTGLPNGKLRIKIGDGSIWDVEMPLEMRNRLLSSVNENRKLARGIN